MPEIRPSIAAIMPKRMVGRPIDHRGFPVPWFVTDKDDAGKWEFRMVRPERQAEAVRRRVCWICGHPLGRNLAFAVGPMCLVNHLSAEPPQHLLCARFAVRACPFMVAPKAVRRDAGLAEQKAPPAGIMIERNPGVVALVKCRNFWIKRQGRSGLLFYFDPLSVDWWTEGRHATRTEVVASFDAGTPTLRQIAEAESPDAVAAFERMAAAARTWFPG